MSDTLVYHWFSPAPLRRPWQIMSAPVVLSIATLRRWEPTLPIVVLDASDDHQDWGPWPGWLNFTVVRRRWTLRDTWFAVRCGPLAKKWTYHQRLLSAPGDVIAACEAGDIQAPGVIVADADLFFTGPLQPLGGDRTRSCCGDNTGLWYFDRRDPVQADTLRWWADLCRAACTDSETAARCVQAGQHLHDEAVIRYLRRTRPERFSEPPRGENCPWSAWAAGTAGDARTIHPHGTEFPGLAKGLLCREVIELRAACEAVAYPAALRDIWGPGEATVSLTDPAGLRGLAARFRSSVF